MQKSSEDKLYGIQKQQLKNLIKKEYIAIREIPHLVKNMYSFILRPIVLKVAKEGILIDRRRIFGT